jgi:hypothetical protein
MSMERDLRALPEPFANICSIAAAIVGSAVVGAVGSSVAAGKAAKGAEKGADASLQMYETTRGDLMPYNLGGQEAFMAGNRLIMGSPQQQMAMLEGLPGYQFARTQGLKSVQNSAAARGLGVSGAALKGAANYATGLADSTFGAQFNRLMQSATIGENAAAQTGAAGTAAGQQISTALTNAGAAQAAGISGAANSVGQGLLGYGMYGGFGGGGGSYTGNGGPNAIIGADGGFIPY